MVQERGPFTRARAAHVHRKSEPNQSLVFEGRPEPALDDVAWAATTTVSTEFFRTLRIPLLSGRVFTDAETRPTAVVSRSAHERYWAGEDPIGTRFRFGDDGDTWWTVLGIVEDLRNPDADQPPEPPCTYLSSSNRRGAWRSSCAAGLRSP